MSYNIVNHSAASFSAALFSADLRSLTARPRLKRYRSHLHGHAHLPAAHAGRRPGRVHQGGQPQVQDHLAALRP